MRDSGNQTPDTPDTQMGVERIEAFSDGVFAVAATLLVLNIQVPHLAPAQVTDVMDALVKQWPAYLSYFVTFMSMGAVWISHHRTFKLYRAADSTLQLLNIVFLMFVTLMPFTTAFFAEYIQQDTTIRLAVVLYGVHWLILGLLNAALWHYAQRAKLLKPIIDPAHLREVAASFGPRGAQGTALAIVIGLVLAIFAPQLSVVLSFLITLLYMRPLLRVIWYSPRSG